MDKGTIVRGLLFVLAWVNSLLASKGMKTIPVLDQSTVAFWVTFVISAYTFYKHNVFGKKVKQIEDAVVKESEVVINEVIDSKLKQPTPVVEPAQPVVTPVAPSNQPLAAEPQQPAPETK